MTYKVLAVPRAGVEPARVAPLVFETSASTDSAIWASNAVQRYIFFLNCTNFFAKMFESVQFFLLLWCEM